MKVYTAVAGKYPIKRDDIECFGDAEIFRLPVMEAKRYKILPHLFFPDAVTIWLDGNIWLKISPDDLVDEFLGDADMAIFKHSYRNTPWQEFAVLREQQRFKIPRLQGQLMLQEMVYRKEGLPDVGLYECNFMIRRNNESVNRLMEAWWAQICRWQERDQVSLPYVLWKHGVRLAAHVCNIRHHPYFRYESQY